MADACNVRQEYFLKLIKDMAEQLLAKLANVIADFENKIGPYPALKRVQKVVRKQCQLTLRELA